MSETVEVMEDLEIIKVTSVGQITENDLQKSRMLIREICRQRGFNKILVDATRLTNRLPTMVAYDHAAMLTSDDILSRAKYAIIASEHTDKNLYFFETAAINRGARVSIFSSGEKALSWLMD